ncbi:type VI secretion system tip protein TssI/VgrG [Azospirillum sp. ST 5-10]|uniref:type VI secretion system Vgr family protein n=1 Tax=unclassified Azospirillum TaxID=2630922 RepID=UPI003F4A8386
MTYQIDFDFFVEGLPRNTFRVTRLDGVEAISRPYRFDLELVSADPDIDFDAVLSQPATLVLRRYGDERTITGVVADFVDGPARPNASYVYRAALVPRLWLLSLSRTNQIYGGGEPIAFPDIAFAKIAGAADVGLGADYMESALYADYPARDHVAQYEESDLDFVSRLLEHVGIFYVFRQDAGRETMVVGDSNLSFPPLSPDAVLSFRPDGGLSAGDGTAVVRFERVVRRMPRTVLLKDYNYRMPHVPLLAEAEVDPRGVGRVTEYNDHFRTPEEGDFLARIRAQELLARKVLFHGDGFDIFLTAGYGFRLADHFRDRFNRTYLVTEVRHTGAAPAEAEGTAGGGVAPWTGYRNSFTCMPADVVFRPERLTPRPRITGIMHSHVDGQGGGERAEIDEEGRYKVQVPFDVSGLGPFQGSQFMRMAQPYAGRQQGMHFPLRKDAEVVWSCIDGNPDRPIILGAVPNALSRSPVTARNHTSNLVHTASGIRMEMFDGPGAADDAADDGAGPGLGAQRPMQGPAAGAGWRAVVDELRASLPAQRPLFGTEEEGDDGEDDEDDGGSDEDERAPSYHIYVPDEGDGTADYLRMGTVEADEDVPAPYTAVEQTIATYMAASVASYLGIIDMSESKEGKEITESTGWVEYTSDTRMRRTDGYSIDSVEKAFVVNADTVYLQARGDAESPGSGDAVIKTKGNLYTVVDGQEVVKIIPNDDHSTYFEMCWSDSDGNSYVAEYNNGTSIDLKVGTVVDVAQALSVGVFEGTKMETNASGTIELNAGFQSGHFYGDATEFTFGTKFEATFGPSIEIAGDKFTLYEGGQAHINTPLGKAITYSAMVLHAAAFACYVTIQYKACANLEDEEAIQKRIGPLLGHLDENAKTQFETGLDDEHKSFESMMELLDPMSTSISIAEAVFAIVAPIAIMAAATSGVGSGHMTFGASAPPTNAAEEEAEKAAKSAEEAEKAAKEAETANVAARRAKNAEEAGEEAEKAAKASENAEKAAKEAEEHAGEAEKAAKEAENAKKAAGDAKKLGEDAEKAEKTAKEAEAASKDAEEAATKAKSEAEDAATKAEDAGREAEAAGDKARSTAKDAEKAGKEAEAATKDAEEAAEKAKAARKAADEGKGTVEDAEKAEREAQQAEERAQQARSNAEEAEKKAQQAEGDAVKAGEKANQADKDAAEAAEKADAAKQDAKDAKDTADQARQEADEAKGKADDAKKAEDEANKSRKAADDAKKNAKHAKKSAEESKESADDAKTWHGRSWSSGAGAVGGHIIAGGTAIATGTKNVDRLIES